MTNAIKKSAAIILATISLFSFTGCFGGEDTPVDTVTPAGFITYEKGDVTITAPEAWEVFTEKDFPTNVPKDTLAVFRNNIKSDIFTANLSISQAEITKGETSKDFSIKSLNAVKNNLVSFQEISREDFQVKKAVTAGTEDEILDTTTLITFQGRKTVTEPLIIFKQLCIAKTGYGLIITASYLPNDDQSVVIKLDDMLKSLRLK
jgi:hypothetical protein